MALKKFYRSFCDPLSDNCLMSQVDQKFEFSRRRLVLEETLGEGEFGRVLAGRALDAAGTGYTRSLLLNFKSWLNIAHHMKESL